MKEKENTTATPKRRKLIYSIILAVCVLLLVTATVLTVYFVTSGGNEVLDEPPLDNNPPVDDDPPHEDPTKPSGGQSVQFISPVKDAACTVEYFKEYYNASRNVYYYHRAMDFAADAGTEVLAMSDGKVVSVINNEVTGNSITIRHADGVETVYRFVEAAEGLNEGDTVQQGQVIATVAEAYGTEYKDGTHLHLEMKVDDKYVDPAKYIDQTLEEK